jgi:DNA replication initiation complex subunit (GINS family)
MTHIHITYETLFDLLRKERSLEDLQSLDPLFWSHVVSYINERTEFLKQTSLAEQEKTKLQLSNIKRILKEIYDHRERKIITLARTVVRMQETDFADTKNMLPEEKVFFDEAIELFSKYKKEILLAVYNNKRPTIFPPLKNTFSSLQELSQATNDSSLSNQKNSSDAGANAGYDDFPYAISNEPDGVEEHFSTENDVIKQEEKNLSAEDKFENKDNDISNTSCFPQQKSQEFHSNDSFFSKTNSTDLKKESSQESLENENLILVKFIMDIPKFVGRDKELFGPFKEDEIVSLPSYVANILISKQKAKAVLGE